MKFLLHGNSPHCATGYGIQLGQLGTLLRDAGHEVAFSATYGQQGSVGSYNGMRIYPCGFDTNSNDLLHSHADHWMDGDGWIITCIDVWAMISPRLKDYNVAAWTPIDHQPIQPNVLEFFSESQAVPIAMSEFGFREMHEVGLDAVYIPLSIDTNVYKPTPSIEVNGKKTAGRELLGLPEDAFVIGMVAMNKGWARDRKGFNEAFLAVGQMMKQHDDVYLYMHSERWGGAEGVNLVELAIHASIPDHKLIWAGGPDQYGYRLGFTHPMMAVSYSTFDVLLAPSHGEGFCVPIIEAQACFSASTLVTATDVLETFEHSFTGDLLTIETERGDTIEATSDHPFWTDRGWVTARDLNISDHQLLYTGGHAEAEHVHAGRLGNLVASLRGDASRRSGEEDGPHLRFGALAQEPDGSHENLRPDRAIDASHGDAAGVGIHGRDDRRRGDRLDPEVQWEVEAFDPDREYERAGDGLVLAGVRSSIDLRRASEDPTGQRPAMFHVPYPGIRTSSAVCLALPFTRHQASTDGMRHRIHSTEAVSEPYGTVHAPPIGTSPTSARPEYQAIRSISRRAVVDFPVYNLRTASGTYMAGGYLVHNCGTPVIASDFSAQSELTDQGWLVHGQPEWDPAHHAFYLCPNVIGILQSLEDAYSTDREAMKEPAVEFASRFDMQTVFDKYWVPFVESLEAPGQKLSVEREPMPDENAVAVLVPVLNRPENVQPLVDSFRENTPEGEARLVFVAEYGDGHEERAIHEAGGFCIQSPRPVHTFAEKLNYGLKHTTEPWVLCIGDDVRFHEGWLDQARKLSSEFDVIGTNDTAGKVKNPKVANGSHADHFFVRRAYVEEYGACLDGPGVLAPECYRHWFVDREIVDLARARGVFSPCLDSVVEHLHPGYDGDEAARQADPTYMMAVAHSEEDQKTFIDRVPLIEMQRTTRARVR